MDNNVNNEKKDSGKNITIVILIILLLCSGGYIAYDKFLSNNVSKNSDDSKIEQQDEIIKDDKNDTISKSNFSTTNKAEIQSLGGYNYRLYVSKDGNAFLTFDNSLNTNNENVKKNIENLKNKYTLNEIKGYCNTEGDLAKEICPNGDSINSIKLDLTNVISAYDAVSGQDAFGNYIVFLMEDGSVSRVNLGKLFENGVLDIEKNVDGLSNIVTIVQSSSTGVPSGFYKILAIESNGTQHVLSTNP